MTEYHAVITLRLLLLLLLLLLLQLTVGLYLKCCSDAIYSSATAAGLNLPWQMRDQCQNLQRVTQRVHLGSALRRLIQLFSQCCKVSVIFPSEVGYLKKIMLHLLLLILCFFCFHCCWKFKTICSSFTFSIRRHRKTIDPNDGLTKNDGRENNGT